MIVATAGHVDHGKTSLIKQLTGVDTDRLEEEKRRGLSINLGYAFRTLDDDNIIGFIDVPGHTRFINSMIAGVGGIDMAMLVVAADDGVMPQTKEHLDVLRLLGQQKFVIVISKIDRVDAVRVKEVAAQVKTLIDDAVTIFEIDNISGEGIVELQQYLDHTARNSKAASHHGHFRMSIDRVFSIKGSGLVVTGTALAGKVEEGETLLLQPQNTQVRVRSIHAQDKKVTVGYAGQRCAINISGDIDRESLARGNALVGEQLSTLSHNCDVSFSLLASVNFPLKHLCPVKIHLGAGRFSGKIFFLESNRKLKPGESTLAQILFDQPVSVCHGDRFFLRDDSESISLGGGVVLDPIAPQAKKSTPARLSTLKILQSDDPKAVLHALVVEQGQIVDLQAFRGSWNISEQEQAQFIGDDMLVVADEMLSKVHWSQLKSHLLSTVTKLHREQPSSEGISTRELQTGVKDSVFTAILSELIQTDGLVLKNGFVGLKKHKSSLSPEQQALWVKIEKVYQQSDTHLPVMADLLKATNIPKKNLIGFLQSRVKEGKLLKVNDNRFARPQELYQLSNKAIELGADNKAFDAKQYRDAIGMGRNLAIELLEYFDEIRFTERSGNERRIINASIPEKLFQS
ncbi:MAG: selenocysteine-specific translation elongation factor [Oceanicoccus sp.]